MNQRPHTDRAPARAGTGPTSTLGHRVVLEPPPPLQQTDAGGSVLVNVLPLMGSLGSIALVATMSSGENRTRGLLAAGLLVFATLGFLAVQVDRQRRQRAQRTGSSRSAYFAYLDDVRALARSAAEQQRSRLTWHFPAPDALPALAEERSRLWERHPDDEQFARVRYGTTTWPSDLELVAPESNSAEPVDPAADSAVHRLVAVHQVQPDLPAVLDLRAFGRVELCGPPELTRAAARALITSATAFHDPEHLTLAVLADEHALAHWDWVKWLPHAASSAESDAVGPRRAVSTDLNELTRLLPSDLAERPAFGSTDPVVGGHLLVVVDGGQVPLTHPLLGDEGLAGVTVLDIASRWDDLGDGPGVRIELLGPAEAGRAPALVSRWQHEPFRALADLTDLTTAEAFARRLAPLHHAGRAGGDISTPVDYSDLLGVGDLDQLSPSQAWAPREARDLLRVPIGVGEGGAPVHLDLKESAQQGMGPHGLVVGATGSGKSEFLRTLVLGLALTHSPEQLNLVLVDFKGGATFAGMAELPHVSAVITNLADDLTLVDRMQDALTGEMVRRQEILRASGNHASVRDYERARAAGEDLPPLPSVLIVVDEFSELLSAKPEFIDLFVAIGRLGRSLGLHLLLASQRLEEGRLRGLESHLSYRVGLRTFSAAESRTVLGVPDAYELPPVPGLGYLRPDHTTLVRFKASYVSGPPMQQPDVARGPGGQVRGILPFTISEVQSLTGLAGEEPTPTPVVASGGESVLDLAVGRLAPVGPMAHRVWLPPLDVPETLDELLGDLTVDPALGLVSIGWRAAGPLVLPVGTVDQPREQRRERLILDLGGAAGHLAVVGRARSGRSTVLRTVVASLALTTTPLESQVYVLDFGGGAFAPLVDLPHVAGHATRNEAEAVRRIVAEVTGVLAARETYFREHGIDSVDSYRQRRAAGTADDGYGDLFVVIDGWSTLRREFEELEQQLTELAGRGLGYGVHLLVSATRWSDFRASARDLFGSRVELRLGDPLDSEIDRRAADLVPQDRPGRGLVPGRWHALGALPRIDGVADGSTLGDGLDDLTARVREAWSGPQGPKLRMLPTRLPHEELLAQAGGVEERSLVVGVDEKALAPVALDVDAHPHLLVFGDGQSGKSTFLRSYLREVVRTRSADEAQVMVVDHRRSLLGEVPEGHLLNYLTNSAQSTPALAELAEYLTNRLPGPDVTPEQLRTRSWWTGADVFVVVDDYDLVSTAQGSPLAVLAPLLAQATDVGLHLVLARRAGGASRALYEPVIQTLRDLSSPGLLLSGPREEGALLGSTRPVPAPPGRAQLVTRSGAEVVQLSWTEPAL